MLPEHICLPRKRVLPGSDVRPRAHAPSAHEDANQMRVRPSSKPDTPRADEKASRHRKFVSFVNEIRYRWKLLNQSVFKMNRIARRSIPVRVREATQELSVYLIQFLC